MIVLAITGGIGSGKSTARRILEKLGAVGIDADQVARSVVEPGTEGSRKVRKAFGPDFFGPDGRLLRDRMAQHVFADPSARLSLEAILHPLIRKEEDRRIREAGRRNRAALVAVEVPLLAEATGRDPYDAVLLISAPDRVRMERAVASGRYSREDAQARLVSQTDDVKRRRVADFEVDNSGTEEELEERLRAVLKRLGWTLPGRN